MPKKLLHLLIIFTFFFLVLSILYFRILPNFRETKDLEAQVEAIEARDYKDQEDITEEETQGEEEAPTSLPETKEEESPQVAPLANTEKRGQGRIICIDPGHQAQGNPGQEKVAPSSSQTKAKVSSGTRGVSSGVAEYQWNMDFSLLLKSLLEEEGYQVVLTREGNQVDLSNQERAQIANNSGAQIYIRIHANATGSPSVSGIETYYVSPNNPDAGQWSQASQKLCNLILDQVLAKTGATNRGAMARDDLTGSNFAQIPTALLELGYMSNPQEDQKLQDPAYQKLMAQGILEGINQYFQNE